MLCYSTGSLPDAFGSEEIIQALLPTPFRGVEWVVTPEMLKRSGDRSFWEGRRIDLEARGFRVRNVHLGAPLLLGPEPHRPGLSSLDPAGRMRRLEAALAATRLAESLGSPHCTVTTGLPERDGDLAEQEARLRETLAELTARKPAGVKILVEQEPEHVIHGTQQLLALCQTFPDEVFANFDVGHSAVLGEDIPACLRRLAPYLRNVHFEDIGSRVHRHLLFGAGDIRFDAIFSALREIGYTGDYTPDLYPFKDAYQSALTDSTAFLGRHGLSA